jgi:hypothetical protein
MGLEGHYPLLFAIWLAHRMEVRTGWIILFAVLGLILMTARWVRIGFPPNSGNPGWREMAWWGLAELTVTFVLVALTIVTRFLWSGMPVLWLLLVALSLRFRLLLSQSFPMTLSE